MKIIKYASCFVFICTFLGFCIFANQGADHQPTANLRELKKPAADRSYTPPKLPEGVFRLYGNRPVFIGPQLTEEALEVFLSSYPILHVVDLAKEKKAQAILTNEAEKAICEDFILFPANYYPLNIEGRGGQLNETALAFIDSLVDTYQPVFIHCRNGVHRAKVPAARAYARDGYKFNTIVDLLKWEDVVTNSQYDRYTNNVWEYAQQFNHPIISKK
jgi:hypothetical protein